MHYIDPTRDAPIAALSWFVRPCIDAFSVVQRRLGWSSACVAAGAFGCRVEFARRGVLLAITYWLGLPPVVELIRPGPDSRSLVTFPWLPPRALPRVVASLHARLREAAGDFAALEQGADEAVPPAERPALERAMRGHLRIVAADLLRRHREALAPVVSAPRIRRWPSRRPSTR
jgi:hypothetical protein